LIRRLESLDVRPDSLDALIITHEHLDHIRGAGPLARRFDLPVHINNLTLKKGSRAVGNLSRPLHVHPGQTITLKDLVVETFTKCHDAIDPMGLIIASDGARLGLLTDLGRSTGLVQDRLKGCQALILEFNHDPDMLAQGPYSLALKRRIRGPEGHLSNQQAGEILRVVSDENLRHLVLAHLSEVNNQPEKALREARRALRECGLYRTKILVSRQDSPIPMVEMRC